MQLANDLRYAFRQLRRSPGFAITAVLTLALGIGATTAVFSVIDAVLLRPLPFPHPESIVAVESHSQGGYTQPASYIGYRDERAQLKTFAAFAAYDTKGINLESPHGAVALHAVTGSDNFFDVFAMTPLLGRTFRPGEEQPGHNDVAVLSHEVWQRDFSADPQVVGSIARLDGRPYTIIGVMPADFRFPLGQRGAIYTPLHVTPLEASRRGSHWLPTIGRLKPGVTRQQGELDMQRVFADLGRAYPDTDGGRTVLLHSLASSVSHSLTSPLSAMAGAVLAVLLLCCVNIAGLLMARGVRREREIAVRAAVGAGRATLIRQMLTESLGLAILGSAVGVLVAMLVLSGMREFLVTAMQRGGEVHLNLAALAVAIVMAVVTSALAGALPALRLARVDPNRALRSGGSAGISRAHHRLRAAFIVTQVALALVLLFTSGLLVRAIVAQRHTNLGFDAAHIVSTEIDLSPGRYENRDPYGNLYQPLLDRLEHTPGIVDAGIINITPIQSWGSNSDIHIKGQPAPPPNLEVLAENRILSPGYFRTFGIHLVRGRMLDPAIDHADGPLHAVVNEAFVRKFFAHGGEPLGAEIESWKAQIVGVVSNVRQDLDQPPMAEMDVLASNVPAEWKLPTLTSTNLVAHTNGDPHAAYGAIRAALQQVDSSIPFRTPETMEEIVNDQLVFQRMESWLFGGFAAVALLLAVVGIYGLLSHEVELGTRDIGMRMALGATRASVLRRIARRAAAMVTGGVMAGALLALLAWKAIGSVVPHLSGHPVGPFLAIAAVLFFIALLASLIPARRAASIEPMIALRTE